MRRGELDSGPPPPSGWMRAQGGGLVVDMASSAGLVDKAPPPRPDEPGWLGAVYGTSEAALNQLSRLLAAELLGDGITVVAFEPGFTRTEATELHAARFGIDLGFAHRMEPVARAVGLLATSIDQSAYAGCFVSFEEVLEREDRST